jgi:tol-pal system protein YbgF
MIKKIPSRLACACLVLAALLPLHANAGIFDDAEARKAILDLRAKVDVLTRDLNERLDSKSDRSIGLDMVNQHERTMAEIAKLRGALEVLSNEVVTAQRRQKELYADLDARLRKLEPREISIDGQNVSVNPNEQRAYDAALLLFQAGDYKAAATALTDFVRSYPNSGYAPNAQYWLGNAYYAQRDYKKAIAAQGVVTTAYGDSAKAPDAMLNIATSYAELKDNVNAKKSLKALVSKYPDSSAAQAAKDRLASLK